MVFKIRIAIIYITESGRELTKIISGVLSQDPRVVHLEIFNKNVKENLKTVFQTSNCVIGIMATGIMVRSICGIIKSKDEDPAVIVIDEKGKHVISLLSGHLGGANDIATEIASIIGGEPVITTSTDINSKLGVDSLARRYYMNIDDLTKIKDINNSLITNEIVDISLNSKFNYIWEDEDVKSSYNRVSEKANTVSVSTKNVGVDLKPKRMVVGLGSRKGVEVESVLFGINSALDILKLPMDRIDAIATGEMKKNEPGIVGASLKLGIPLELISEKSIKEYENTDLTSSEFVMEKFGVGGVCEPSALIAAGDNSELIFKKTPYNGVTVAVAVSKN